MGSINIQDSGFIKTDNSGTQATSGNRANSGTVISLKSAIFIPSLSRNVSIQPELGSTTPAEVNVGSIENMQFQLTCKFKTNNSTDMGNVKHLLDMVRTNGYKLMWYNFSDATAEDNNGQLIFRIADNSIFGDVFTSGEQTNFSVSSNFSHLHVHFLNIQPRHEARTNVIVCVLQGVLLPVEVSSI